MRKWNSKSLIIVIVITSALLSSCVIRKKIKHYPDFTGYHKIAPEITRHSDTLFTYKDNYLLQNKYKQWELYLHGDALERGLIAGALMDSLSNYQEDAFVAEINKIVPDKKKQKRLLRFIGWFNRKIYKYIPNEYLVELYGLSRYMSDKYNFIGPPYLRTLYYHAAHDIGHALVNFSMVECSSAALWGGRSADGTLILGRNLDFYMSDQFAENRLILFVNPEEGIPYVSVAWPGMMGVVSGMNKKGLTITMNAGKSRFPLVAKEPISLLARDILEHASNIAEAIEIASNSEVFVSEALMVGSAQDGKAVVIEISPKNFGVYEVNGNELICTNHFQSAAYKNDKRNNKRIKTGHSLYRYARMQQLLAEAGELTPQKMVEILRNRRGLYGEKIGLGNQKAINQLLSHHGVIFKPQERLIWVAAPPYNEGAFTAYDLEEVFSRDSTLKYQSMQIDSLTIPADSFLQSQAYKNYEKYRKLDRKIDSMLRKDNFEVPLDTAFLSYYRSLNPHLWSVHYKAGLLYFYHKKYQKAKSAFLQAFHCEVTTKQDCEKLQEMLDKSEKQLK